MRPQRAWTLARGASGRRATPRRFSQLLLGGSGDERPRNGALKGHGMSARLGWSCIATVSSIIWACSDTTAPEQLSCPEAPVLLCAKGDVAVAVRAVARDAESRSVAGLKNASAAATIKQRLGFLSVALTEGNITAARDALSDARSAIVAAKSQVGQFPGDGPDLSAIELALLQVENTLK